MDIGGIDLRLTAVPRKAYDLRVILSAVAPLWPESIFEPANDECATPVSVVLDRDTTVACNEFFVFRNKASAWEWGRKGATAKNGNDMLHFIATKVRDGNSIEITMVVGDFTPEMGHLYWTIDNALANAKGDFRIT